MPYMPGAGCKWYSFDLSSLGALPIHHSQFTIKGFLHFPRIFLTGEAGIGKTLLAQEFSKQAQVRHSKLVVASGNCSAFTGIGDPYLPFREILEIMSGDVETRWVAGEISRTAARRLWGAVPHGVKALVDVGPDLVDTICFSLPDSPVSIKSRIWQIMRTHFLVRGRDT